MYEKLEEGYSTQRPPMFNGKFYTYWKNRMEIFIKAENYQVWRVIEVGDYEVTKTLSNNEVVPKEISEYDREDFDKMEINAKAVKLLHCGLGPHEHNRVMGCKSAKQIWDLLEITHEGTSEVKRSKIDLLMSKYERFEMMPKETIQDMLTRFTNITNELVSLGKDIPIDEQVRKVLRSLPQDEKWRAKVTTLMETKDFTKFNIEQLAGSLLTHELHLGTSGENSRSKGLALKAEESNESEEDDEEAAMLVRRFKRAFNRNRSSYRNSGRKLTSSKKDYECHKCGFSEHFIKDCPQWDNEKAKSKGKEQFKEKKDYNKEKYYKPSYSKNDVRRAMIAAWGDSESEEEEEEQPNEETAHLCLMAESESSEFPEELDEQVKYDPNILKSVSKQDLINLVVDFHEDWTIIRKEKNECEKALKICKEHSEWLKTNRVEIEERFFDLFDKNTHLKEKVENLEKELSQVTMELNCYKLFNLDIKSNSSTSFCDRSVLKELKGNLEKEKSEKEQLSLELAKIKENKDKQREVPKWILNAQTKRTEGLGFNYKKKKSNQNKYVELPSSKICLFCGNSGHLKEQCSKRNNSIKQNSRHIKQTWIEKVYDDMSIQEPKETWVPPLNH